jgi:hypothetical protein
MVFLDKTSSSRSQGTEAIGPSPASVPSRTIERREHQRVSVLVLLRMKQPAVLKRRLRSRDLREQHAPPEAVVPQLRCAPQSRRARAPQGRRASFSRGRSGASRFRCPEQIPFGFIGRNFRWVSVKCQANSVSGVTIVATCAKTFRPSFFALAASRRRWSSVNCMLVIADLFPQNTIFCN